MARRPAPAEQAGLLDEIGEWLDREVREIRAYLASPEGQHLRRRVAQVLIIGAPILFRTKFVRRNPVGRVLGVVGGAALVVKLAEALRDWEPIEELAEDLGLKEEDDLD